MPQQINTRPKTKQTQWWFSIREKNFAFKQWSVGDSLLGKEGSSCPRSLSVRGLLYAGLCVTPQTLLVHPVCIRPVVLEDTVPLVSSTPLTLQPACLLFYIVLWAQSGGAQWSSGPSVPKPLTFCPWWNCLHQVQWERRESGRTDTRVRLCDMSAPILLLCVEQYSPSFLILVSP